MKLFTAIGEIIAVIVALVTIVERPGEGEEKKQAVVDLFFEKATEHIKGLPTWARGLFLRRTFISWLVDVVVWAANSFGFFATPDEPATESGA